MRNVYTAGIDSNIVGVYIVHVIDRMCISIVYAFVRARG